MLSYENISFSKYCSFSTQFLFLYYRKKNVALNERLKDVINNLRPKGRVIFETVDLNEENGYDPSAGRFTAPASGMHVFDWTTLTQRGKIAHTSLVGNGRSKSWTHCDDSELKTFLSCSKMAVLKLKQEDKVWIGVFSSQASMYDQYTSFSGYKHKANVTG